jgi:hypothetical protein
MHPGVMPVALLLTALISVPVPAQEVRPDWEFARPSVAMDFLICADSLSPTGGELP